MIWSRSIGAATGYGALALGSLLATALLYRYGDHLVAWDRRVRQRAYDWHPAFQLWWNPYKRPTPGWVWVPLGAFCLLLTTVFTIAAVEAL